MHYAQQELNAVARLQRERRDQRIAQIDAEQRRENLLSVLPTYYDTPEQAPPAYDDDTPEQAPPAYDGGHVYAPPAHGDFRTVYDRAPPPPAQPYDYSKRF